MQGVVATLGRQRLFMDRDRFTSILLHWVYSRVRPPDFRRPSFEKRPVPNGRQNCLQTCAVRIAGSLCLLVHCQRNAAGHLLRLVGRTHLMLESLCVCVCSNHKRRHNLCVLCMPRPFFSNCDVDVKAPNKPEFFYALFPWETPERHQVTWECIFSGWGYVLCLYCMV